MSKITLDNLSDNLKALLNNSGSGLTEEQVNEIVEELLKDYVTKGDISGFQEKIDNGLATNSKDLVGAINELKAELDGLVDEGINLINDITDNL